MLVTRIDICGGIASGKTSLASLMSRGGFNAILEDFSVNPFWEAFYSSPGKYIFETEISFLLQHYHQIKKFTSMNKTSICDFSLILDKAYAEIGLRGSNLDAFMAVYKEVKRELRNPLVLVHLECDPEIELERIRKRGRTIEKNITLKFLKELNAALKQEVNMVKKETRIFTIDSGADNFVDDESTKKEIIETLVSIVNKPAALSV